MRLNLLLILTLFSTLTLGQERKQWSVPNIVYSCTATVGQDKSSVYMHTNPFDLKMRSNVFHKLTAADFVNPAKGNVLNTLYGTSLENIEVDLEVSSMGENGVSLKGIYWVHPEALNQPVGITTETSKKGIPEKLNISSDLRIAGSKENLANGGIYFRVYCKLKSTF